MAALPKSLPIGVLSASCSMRSASALSAGGTGAGMYWVTTMGGDCGNCGN
ncbi:MAG: hypothetical protein V1929_08870 [bacterium]